MRRHCSSNFQHLLKAHTPTSLQTTCSARLWIRELKLLQTLERFIYFSTKCLRTLLLLPDGLISKPPFFLYATMSSEYIKIHGVNKTYPVDCSRHANGVLLMRRVRGQRQGFYNSRAGNVQTAARRAVIGRESFHFTQLGQTVVKPHTRSQW